MRPLAAVFTLAVLAVAQERPRVVSRPRKVGAGYVPRDQQETAANAARLDEAAQLLLQNETADASSSDSASFEGEGTVGPGAPARPEAGPEAGGPSGSPRRELLGQNQRKLARLELTGIDCPNRVAAGAPCEAAPKLVPASGYGFNHAGAVELILARLGAEVIVFWAGRAPGAGIWAMRRPRSDWELWLGGGAALQIFSKSGAWVFGVFWGVEGPLRAGPVRGRDARPRAALGGRAGGQPRRRAGGAARGPPLPHQPLQQRLAAHLLHFCPSPAHRGPQGGRPPL